MLINDILDYSKMEAGKLDLEMIDFDLRAAVESVTELLAEQAQRKGLKLVSLVHASTPTAVRGDPCRLRQILMNLVGNAVKFTEQGRVVLQVRTTEDHRDSVTLLFEVTDTGIGIPLEKHGTTLATEAGAAGYLTKPLRYTQLYECLRVVLAQSPGASGFGGLSVDTRTGDGTVPHSTPRQTGLVTRHTLAEARAQQAERILLADESEANQMLVVRLLERRGYQVDVVAGGSELLVALAQKHYDLLFLDCLMPDMNGFETARRIRSSESPGRRILIIAITANVLPEDRRRCMDFGMDDCLANRSTETIFSLLLRGGCRQP